MHGTARGGLLIFCLLLAGCTAREEARIATLLPPSATPAAFTVCHGGGCDSRTRTSISPEAWARLRGAMPPAADAATERRQVAQAIAFLERIVGGRVGTEGDRGRNVIAVEQSTQLDCVDEAVNTTTYLRMLAADGLLVWHRVGMPAGRGTLLDGRWPHNTAVLIEAATGAAWAIDSWFFDNGVPAAVVPLAAWRAGWVPEDGPAVSAAAGAGERRAGDPPG